LAADGPAERRDRPVNAAWRRLCVDCAPFLCLAQPVSGSVKRRDDRNLLFDLHFNPIDRGLNLDAMNRRVSICTRAFCGSLVLSAISRICSIGASACAFGDICDLFTPAECKNYFTAAGYGFI
jgi:hypothetical protein